MTSVVVAAFVFRMAAEYFAFASASAFEFLLVLADADGVGVGTKLACNTVNSLPVRTTVHKEKSELPLLQPKTIK